MNSGDRILAARQIEAAVILSARQVGVLTRVALPALGRSFQEATAAFREFGDALKAIEDGKPWWRWPWWR